jgi:hypothetical protein
MLSLINGYRARVVNVSSAASQVPKLNDRLAKLLFAPDLTIPKLLDVFSEYENAVPGPLPDGWPAQDTYLPVRQSWEIACPN